MSLVRTSRRTVRRARPNPPIHRMTMKSHPVWSASSVSAGGPDRGLCCPRGSRSSQPAHGWILGGARGMAEAVVNATGNHVRPLGPPHQGPWTGGLRPQERTVSRFCRLDSETQASAGLGPPSSRRKGPFWAALLGSWAAASSRHLLMLSLLRASRPPPSVRTRVV